MSNSKHTPGPWKFIDGAIFAANGAEVCDPTNGVGADRKLLPIDEREANARLIAASPKLLWVALQVALWDSLSEHERASVVSDAIAAIAEAEGR